MGVFSRGQIVLDKFGNSGNTVYRENALLTILISSKEYQVFSQRKHSSYASKTPEIRAKFAVSKTEMSIKMSSCKPKQPFFNSLGNACTSLILIACIGCLSHHSLSTHLM